MKNILPAQKLIDVAFRRAMKIKPPKARTGELDRQKQLEINRVNTIASILIDKLDVVIHDFPSINLLHPFYSDLLDIFQSIDDIKRMLGRIHGTIRYLRELQQEYIAEIQLAEFRDKIRRIRKSAFGRMAKIIRNLDKSLVLLEEIRNQLAELPSYDPSTPCVVVSGLPNVGKSSFIRVATSGKPEVAKYPFTTKKLIFGHRKFKYLNIQFVDTPGILDRDISDRNEIELLALTALKHLADVMIYLFDFTQHTPEILNSQVNLFREIRNFYPASNFVVVVTKADILDDEMIDFAYNYLISNEVIGRKAEFLSISCEGDQDILPLISKIQNIIQKSVLLSSKFKEMLRFDLESDEDTYEEELWFLN